MKKRLFIITGAPGTGKTSIIEKLSSLGYKAGGEYARDIINEQQKSGGDILPWKDIKAFQDEVLRKRLDFYNSVGDNEIAFADRGIPDQITFAVYRGFTPEKLLDKFENYRYADTVFITKPWREIYCTDQVRKESFEEIVKIHETNCQVYRDLNYKLVPVPQVTTCKRAKFVINYINKIN